MRAHQLPDAEGLDEVVVGAHFEPDDLVDLVCPRREEEDRRVCLATQLAEHLESIDPGQAHVEHDEVRRRVGEVRDRVLAGRLHAHRIALALERNLHAARDGGLVLDDHDRAGHPRSIGIRQCPARFAHLKIPYPPAARASRRSANGAALRILIRE